MMPKTVIDSLKTVKNLDEKLMEEKKILKKKEQKFLNKLKEAK